MTLCKAILAIVFIELDFYVRLNLRAHIEMCNRRVSRSCLNPRQFLEAERCKFTISAPPKKSALTYPLNDAIISIFINNQKIVRNPLQMQNSREPIHVSIRQIN